MRKALYVVFMVGTVTIAHAQAVTPEEPMVGWPPVPPLNDQSGIRNYCIHRNLLYSIGDVLCVGFQGVVCVPPTGSVGGRPYWSSVPISRGDINWAPPPCTK
jgi:hypothetical protein